MELFRLIFVLTTVPDPELVSDCLLFGLTLNPESNVHGSWTRFRNDHIVDQVLSRLKNHRLVGAARLSCVAMPLRRKRFRKPSLPERVDGADHRQLRPTGTVWRGDP